jgi:hypothetical protein
VHAGFLLTALCVVFIDVCRVGWCRLTFGKHWLPLLGCIAQACVFVSGNMVIAASVCLDDVLLGVDGSSLHYQGGQEICVVCRCVQPAAPWAALHSSCGPGALYLMQNLGV